MGSPVREHDEEAESAHTVQLSAKEAREVEQRSPPRAAVVVETVRREGEIELERPTLSLVTSGLAAGLSMGFSMVASGVILSLLPAGATWRPLLESFGYSLGFLIVVMGRQQLFTENTVTVILPLLAAPNKLATLRKVARLWAIVLGMNIVGAIAFAFTLANTGIFEEPVKAAFLEIGRHATASAPDLQFLRGIFAGWLIALMVWLLPASGELRPVIIVAITYFVGLFGLSHIIAGSIEALYLVALGQLNWLQFGLNFLLPVFLGNCVGGISLVALLNYGQVAAEGESSA